MSVHSVLLEDMIITTFAVITLLAVAISLFWVNCIDEAEGKTLPEEYDIL
jgi:hypothetical protein